MKELLIISGKGGAGKTSLSAALAQLAAPCVLADCDVDAADLHLLLHPDIRVSHAFEAGLLPEIDRTRCTGCGRCVRDCRFEAVGLAGDGKAGLAPESCEGCGVCADHCIAGAISLRPRHCGEWYESETAYGPMFHARLQPGAENSGKLVAAVRNAARKHAEATGAKLLLCDGPPGIGCPVISALSGTDLAVIVTEPTVSGVHDMERTVQLARSFQIPIMVVINKSNLNPAMAGKIASWCRAQQIRIGASIPFDPVFGETLRRGETVLSKPESAPAKLVGELYKTLISFIHQEKQS